VMAIESKDIARARLEAIDNSLGRIYGIPTPFDKKGKAYALPYESTFVELLLSQWGKATSSAVRKALKILHARTGEVSDREVKAVLDQVDTQINMQFPAGVEPVVPDLMKKSYRKGRDPIFRKHRIKVVWDQPDIEAIDWLTDHHMYWIGGYYDKHVSASIADTIAEGMTQGLGRNDIGKSLKTFFDDYPGVANKPDSYWRGMAANGMNRSRNFGLIHGYEEVEVDILVVMAVMDERTSEVCREMNGREIPVVRAAKQRDSIMAAKKPEDIKELAPWPALESIKGKATSTILSSGVVMPPYHFHCRTTVVEK